MSGKTLKWREPILEGFFTTYGRPQLTIPRGYLCISAGCVIKYFITSIRPPRAELSLLWIRWLWLSCKLVLTNLIVWGALGLSKRKALARNLTRMVILSATGFGCSVRTFPRRRQHWEKVWLFGRGEFNYHWGRTGHHHQFLHRSYLKHCMLNYLSDLVPPAASVKWSGRHSPVRSIPLLALQTSSTDERRKWMMKWNEIHYWHFSWILFAGIIRTHHTNTHYSFFLRGRHKPIYLLNID